MTEPDVLESTILWQRIYKSRSILFCVKVCFHLKQKSLDTAFSDSTELFTTYSLPVPYVLHATPRDFGYAGGVLDTTMSWRHQISRVTDNGNKSYINFNLRLWLADTSNLYARLWKFWNSNPFGSTLVGSTNPEPCVRILTSKVVTSKKGETRAPQLQTIWHFSFISHLHLPRFISANNALAGDEYMMVPQSANWRSFLMEQTL